MSNLGSYLSKIKNPAEFGPGTWRILHLLGLDANTYAKKMQYIHIVELIIKTIPCLDPCRKDGLAYLNTTPLTKYWDVMENGEDIGMFMWSVDFHNWVNHKLNKPEVPFDVAYRFYKYPDEFVCDGGCDDKPHLAPKPSKPASTSKVFGFIPI